MRHRSDIVVASWLFIQLCTCERYFNDNYFNLIRQSREHNDVVTSNVQQSAIIMFLLK